MHVHGLLSHQQCSIIRERILSAAFQNALEIRQLQWTGVSLAVYDLPPVQSYSEEPHSIVIVATLILDWITKRQSETLTERFLQ
jgi:hypothetical protein